MQKVRLHVECTGGTKTEGARLKLQLPVAATIVWALGDACRVHLHHSLIVL